MPAVALRGRKVHGLGQLEIGGPAVFLQVCEHPEIGTVESGVLQEFLLFIKNSAILCR